MPPHAGGIERVAHAIHEGLRSRGHAMTWAASNDGFSAGVEGDRARLPSTKFLEERAGIPIPLPFPTAIAMLDDLVRRADVVIVHDCIYPTSAAAAALAWAHGVPVVLVQHVGHVPSGRFMDQVQFAAYRSIGRVALQAASRRIVVSPHVASWFRQVGLRYDFECIPNGIDESKFVLPSLEARADARRALGISPDDRVVLFAGRLVEKKGARRVAAAAQEFAELGIHLVVAGDGPLASLFAGLPVHRLGGVDADGMPRVYASADVLLLPSIGEGFPLTVQEARMCGLATVVSDDPSFTTNLSQTPANHVCESEESVAGACAAVLGAGFDRAAIALDARSRWGVAGFLDAHEAVIRSATRR